MSDATDRKLPVWRSALYVPSNVPKFIDGAHKRGADAIIVDLEDSVPIAERPAARRDLQATAENVARGGADVIVRINRPWRQTMLDLEAAISPRVAALAVTKVDSADHIRLIAEVVSELEAERGMAVGTTQFIAMIETPGAWFQMPDIAKADRRIVALTLGGEDFALAMGMLPNAESAVHAQTAARDRGARRRHPAARLHRHGRGLQGPRRVPPDRAAFAPPRLSRRVGDPSGPDRDPQRGVLARVRTRSPPHKRSSRPTTMPWPRAAARSRSTAR